MRAERELQSERDCDSERKCSQVIARSRTAAAAGQRSWHLLPSSSRPLCRLAAPSSWAALAASAAN